MHTVLIVEDNEPNRDLLSRRLLRHGYQILVAVDGAEGLRLAEAEQPDLILMDMSLPQMTGWEATRRLKEGRSTMRIPVIALTAYAMDSDREQAMQAGCQDFETKPIELSRLLEKMKAVLPQAAG